MIEFEMPPFDEVVLVHDGKTGKKIKAKRTIHKVLGDVFIESDSDNPNWAKIVMEPKAWKELE